MDSALSLESAGLCEPCGEPWGGAIKGQINPSSRSSDDHSSLKRTQKVVFSQVAALESRDPASAHIPSLSRRASCPCPYLCIFLCELVSLCTYLHLYQGGSLVGFFLSLLGCFHDGWSVVASFEGCPFPRGASRRCSLKVFVISPAFSEARRRSGGVTCLKD